MKLSKTILLPISLLFFSEAGHTALSAACNQELRDLVVPPLKGIGLYRSVGVTAAT